MTSIYRRSETDRVNGTINLRVYLRKYLPAAIVNRRLAELNANPYTTQHLATNRYGLDLELDIYPASGQFRIRRNYY
jgi:hypothetical protein